MIVFTKIRFKNFLSFGNNWTEIDLNKSKSTLFTGKNGHGKSTFMDAICFALFGKAYRKINKPQLVNSINENNCLVEIEFTANGLHYLIRRGIKPNVFEIYEKGVLLNQDAASRDYQAFLEQNILRMNFKSFSQIVILGTSSFIPFMRLTPADRRLIVEDILDIGIFSDMNYVLKSKMQTTEESVRTIKTQLIRLTDLETAKESSIKTIEKTISENTNNLETLIQNHEKEILDATQTIDTKQKEILDLVDLQSQNSKNYQKKNKIHTLISQLQTKTNGFQKQKRFYVENSICPSCQQTIADTSKHEFCEKISAKEQELNNALQELSKNLTEIEKEISDQDKRLEDIKTVQSEIVSLKSKISTHSNEILNIKSKIEQSKSNSNLELERTELQNIKSQIDITKQSLSETLKIESHCYVLYEMLKDTGIKSKIIQYYLPHMNSIINDYLTELDFYIDFSLDDTFTEVIKSRKMDVFSYENFSEGEKSRIDLSLLFAWRKIAQMKNSINTNLLILDEIFDGSLDSYGTEDLLKILSNIPESTNIFLISHKSPEIISDKFDSSYVFEKHNDFSTYKKV